jgi:5-oxoprolinase (ATP-hydrolysing)
MAGGEPGKRGLNQWNKKNGQTVNIGGKSSVLVGAGDRVVINTPGGGGYGNKLDKLSTDVVLSSFKGVEQAFVRVAAGTVEAIRSMGESS